LIMAVTIVGSLSIASAGEHEVRTATKAALGCNLAWGLVDAVMYLIRTATERTHNRVLARRIAGADIDTAHRLIAQSLPDGISAITGPQEIEGMRRRLLGLQLEGRKVLRRRDYAEALGVFLLVVIATFPVVIPFLVMSNVAMAMHTSRIVTVGMLFAAGVALGHYAGYDRPLRTGFVMAVIGAALIVAVMALGG